MVTKRERHFDQDERQTDAAVHWDSMRPVLLKALADKGAHEFSEQQWISSISIKEVTRSGSSVVKILKKSWACSRIDGIRLAAIQMERISLPGRMFFRHEIHLRARRKRNKRRTTNHLLLTTQPFRERRRGRSSSWRPVSSEKVSLQQQLET